MVSSGRVVLKARYSIYPIQLCCVGQTGYVGQTDQDSGARAEGTLRLHTRWRAMGTQATTASSPYSSAVGQTGQGYRVRAEGTIRLHTRWRAMGTLRLHARWRASSTLLLHTRRRTPHDCVRMGLIGCRVFDTLRQPTRCRAFSTQAIWACSPYSSTCAPCSSAVGQTGQGYRVRAEGTIRLHTRWRAYSTQAATARVSPARLRPCESPTRLRPYPIRTPSYGVNRMSCLRH